MTRVVPAAGEFGEGSVDFTPVLVSSPPRSLRRNQGSAAPFRESNFGRFFAERGALVFFRAAGKASKAAVSADHQCRRPVPGRAEGRVGDGRARAERLLRISGAEAPRAGNRRCCSRVGR